MNSSTMATIDIEQVLRKLSLDEKIRLLAGKEAR